METGQEFKKGDSALTEERAPRPGLHGGREQRPGWGPAPQQEAIRS